MPPAAEDVMHTFRNVLGQFATGVVVIAAADPETGEPAGLAANSFTSVSLDPPLVGFCIATTSTSWPRIRRAERICINVLSASQEDICKQLATRGGKKFEGVEWSPSPGGAPAIHGAVAWLDVSVEDEHPAGDHVIVVARVMSLGAASEMPLLFFRGSYLPMPA
jgi:flavin reductase (DIM6/NTAB) family NADH-FMN oxidoreductase RutF